MLLCPKCKGEYLAVRLVKGKNGNVKLDVCPVCKGVWFDKDEMEEIEKNAVLELKPPRNAAISLRKCPRCRTGMKTFPYPQTHAEIDQCPECRGLWLDGGEFKEIKYVRRYRQQEGTLENYAPPTGIKKALLDFIENALASIKSGF